MIIKQPLLIDIAYNNENINWKSVSGVRATICKASEGSLIEDSQFKNNWNQIRDAGIPRGAYHFYRWYFPSAWNAKKFLATLKKYGGVKPGDKLFLDDEEEGKMSLTSMIDFTYLVEQETGILCGWYSWAWMLNSLNPRKLTQSQLEYLKKIVIWGAGYPNDPDLFSSPPKSYTADHTKYGPTLIWQYKSEVPNVGGIPNGTDVNWIDADFLAEWEKETFGTSQPPVVVPPSTVGFPRNAQVIAQPSLRVRNGPGMTYLVIDRVINGTTISVLETQEVEGNTWGRINIGWVAMIYQGSVYAVWKD